MQDDAHSHVTASGESPSLDRNLSFSIGLNALIVIVEVAGGLLSGSLALLSDALHNLSDVAALALALAARKLGRRPNSAKHTYGLGRLDVLAALLGIVTPFCSCSAVPLFIGFVTTGVALGVTFSFLVSAPMVNEVALVLLFGLFGWKVAGLYLSTGLLIAIISGWVIGRLRMEKHIEDWVLQTQTGNAVPECKD